jgi:hypothetical protein
MMKKCFVMQCSAVCVFDVYDYYMCWVSLSIELLTWLLKYDIYKTFLMSQRSSGLDDAASAKDSRIAIQLQLRKTKNQHH